MSIQRFLTACASILFAGIPVGRLNAEVAYPQGIQDFESFDVGDDLATVLPTWPIVNTSAPPSNFSLLIADDVMGDCQRRCDSRRWLRSTDIDGANVQNRYYSPEITKMGEQTYQWTFYVNLETTPPGGANGKPRLTIQHRDGANAFANAWGIEFADTGASLIVLGIGGTAASVPLYPISGNFGLGNWVKLDINVNFGTNTVSADANDGTPVSLPINLNGNQNQFRFCYRGEGTGNIMTMLVDDISVCVGNTCPATPSCTTTARQCPTVSATGTLAMAGLVFAMGGWAVRRRQK